MNEACPVHESNYCLLPIAKFLRRDSRLVWYLVGSGAVLGIASLYFGSARKKGVGPATDFESFLKQPKPRPTAKQKPKGTGFDSFLKVCQPAKSFTSFDAFLKNAECNEEAGEVQTDAERLPSGPKGQQVVVTVLYGTEYGFAKEISEKLCSSLRADETYWPHMLDMADFNGGFDVTQESLLLVICSTQGDGVPPSEARGFCDWLSSAAAPQLPSTSYSVCALGDTSYTHFCACGKQLDMRLSALGAKQFVPRQDVNREDWKAVDKWVQAVSEGIKLLKLETVADKGGYEPPGSTAGQGFSKKRPFFGTVIATEGLCNLQKADDKDTIRVEIDLGDSGLTYSPGDALGIYASNAPEAVEDLLHILGEDPQQLQSLPSWHYESEQHPLGSKIALKQILQHCYDLRSPRAELLQLLLDEWQEKPLVPHMELNDEKSKASPQNGKNGYAVHVNGHGPHHWGNSVKRQQLEKLAAASNAKLEEYLAPRHVVDVLLDFPFARPPLEKLLRSLRPLQPRLYSISSSPLEHPNHVQVTVAVVRYNSLARERQGVASTFLAERIKVGEQLPIYVSKNPDFRLPANALTPIIMVGPGTGLAPFRSFIMERMLSASLFGPSLLYFGCRRRDQDFLYGSLLEEWQQEGAIELFTAFSRQQEEKVYVQDRLRESSKRVWELIQRGSHLYVCGDAANMASAVENAFLDIIAEHQGQGMEAATEYLETLTKQDRYQRDVWFS